VLKELMNLTRKCRAKASTTLFDGRLDCV